MQFINNGGNPQQIMQMVLQNNPQASQTISQLQNMAQGQNPRDFAMQLAKQKGIDPQQVEQMARMMGLK